jgi:hypothetical protein
MSHDIKTAIETIPIPPELAERSKKGIENAKLELEQTKAKNRPYKLWMAASVLGIALLASVAFHPQVLAAIQKAVQFIPGIGMALEEEVPKERYILQEPVTVEIGNGSLTVTGVMADSEMTHITMNGINIERMQSIQVINDKGDVYNLDSSIATMAGSQFSASFWHRGALDLQQDVQIVIPGNPETVIPLQLELAKSFASYQDMGETASVNDVMITAIAHRIGDRARISLVSKHPKAFRISDYGIHPVRDDKRLTITDDAGKSYEIDRSLGLSSPAREFYFPLSEHAKKYTLTIPEIQAEYHSTAKLTLEVPAEREAEVNKTIELAGFPIQITKVERIDRKDGSRGLRVYTNVGYDEQAPVSLHRFSIDRSHMLKLNEQTMAAEYIEFDIESDVRKVKLTFDRPEVLIKGPWIFEFPADRYF